MEDFLFNNVINVDQAIEDAKNTLFGTTRKRKTNNYGVMFFNGLQ